jgi:hypothetical protein
VYQLCRVTNIVDARKSHSAPVARRQRPVLDGAQCCSESVSSEATDDRAVEIIDLGGRRRQIRRHRHRERSLCRVQLGDASLKRTVAGDGCGDGYQYQSGDADGDSRDRRQEPALARPRPAKGAFNGDTGATHNVLVALLCRWW